MSDATIKDSGCGLLQIMRSLDTKSHKGEIDLLFKKNKQSKLGCETIFNKPSRVKISWSFSGIEITNHSSFLSLFASKAMNILAILMTQPLYKLSAFPFILKF